LQDGTIPKCRDGSHKLHNDIVFLEYRLSELIEKEDYERAARVHGWINELKNKYELRRRED